MARKRIPACRENTNGEYRESQSRNMDFSGARPSSRPNDTARNGSAAGPRSWSSWSPRSSRSSAAVHRNQATASARPSGAPRSALSVSSSQYRYSARRSSTSPPPPLTMNRSTTVVTAAVQSTARAARGRNVHARIRFTCGPHRSFTSTRIGEYLKGSTGTGPCRLVSNRQFGEYSLFIVFYTDCQNRSE